MTATTTRQLDTVIFRKYADGAVIALFPGISVDSIGHVQSYMHIGQHGAADYGRVLHVTRPATIDDFRALKEELEERGYNLSIRQRRTR